MEWLQQIKQFQPSCEQEQKDQALMLQMAALHSNLLTRDNAIAHMTCSGFIMNAARDHVLFIHHNLYNSWGWTGGHADGDDNFLHVAMKEATEETGVEQVTPFSNDLISLEVLPVVGHVKKGQYVSSHLHLNVTYALMAPDDVALIVCPEENSAVAWIPVNQIAERVNEDFMIPIYKKIIAKIQKLA